MSELARLPITYMVAELLAKYYIAYFVAVAVSKENKNDGSEEAGQAYA